MTETLSINLSIVTYFIIYLLSAYILALAANGWVYGVFTQGKIGYDYIALKTPHWPKWLKDPLYACNICVAGQWSLWSYLAYCFLIVKSFIWVDIPIGIIFILITISLNNQNALKYE